VLNGAAAVASHVIGGLMGATQSGKNIVDEYKEITS
jgi:hypothetical protein